MFNFRLGPLLRVIAAFALLHMVGVLHEDGRTLRGIAFLGLVFLILFGPWLVSLVRSLASERAALIREQERAELAAHLHDSVLQTLALIQKRVGDGHEVAQLARRQERELRRWLFEPRSAQVEGSMRAALEEAAAEVEELHGVQIETVVVGDMPIDDRVHALAQAAREAMTNAAKFARCGRVDLYAEVDAGNVEVFVRDRGIGFDPASIPADRRGVRDSIIGRVERHGGRAVVHSAPGEGTEVELAIGTAQA
jgi:signal transduction histidine kinase